MPISEFEFCHKTSFLYWQNIKTQNAQNKINKTKIKPSKKHQKQRHFKQHQTIKIKQK